ncbi:hypothetical protein COCVIDRAFT_91221 [Bipolaris victoriae FI3]|uniref:Uncharacterized protein n=1 Tax=Bipolaris victoriae (strain FI3) TaxID=930091 RepID=W7F1J0_BIPV3|nr:hypothetical protein COCVIDRAFT_91221 [Bipolaris victoriae FI3]
MTVNAGARTFGLAGGNRTPTQKRKKSTVIPIRSITVTGHVLAIKVSSGIIHRSFTVVVNCLCFLFHFFKESPVSITACIDHFDIKL